MNEDQTIKVGFCVAYDWYLLKTALPLVYDQADRICLALDKDRISWARLPFSFDEKAFYAFVAELDTEKKIDIYEDDFHQSSLTPMQNEVRQRNMIAARQGRGGWHIQLDADEYMIDFKGFVAYLKSLNLRRPSNVNCIYNTIFKKVEGGYLMIRERAKQFIEFFPVATTFPDYKYGRRNDNFNHKCRFVVLHQSWAREESEIRQKIENWGHKEDFDVEAYFRFWKGINAANYKQVKDFHPIAPEMWQELELIPGEQMDSVVHNMATAKSAAYSDLQLMIENNIWYRRFHSIVKKMREG